MDLTNAGRAVEQLIEVLDSETYLERLRFGSIGEIKIEPHDRGFIVTIRSKLGKLFKYAAYCDGFEVTIDGVC